ncbi:aryldialkylphosphatase, partial [Pseudomonas syringae pv. actinidiae ICMP 19096]
GYSIPVPREETAFLALGRGWFLGVPLAAWLALLVTLGGVLVLGKMRFGRYLTGIGANAESVRRAGVNHRGVLLRVYMLSGMAAALAGMIVTARLGSGSSAGCADHGRDQERADPGPRLTVLHTNRHRTDRAAGDLVEHTHSAYRSAPREGWSMSLFRHPSPLPVGVDSGHAMTVLGPIPVERLGVTLMHEHILLDASGKWVAPSCCGERHLAERPVSIELLGELHMNPLVSRDNCQLFDVDLACEELLKYRALGGETVVDPTNLGIGRDPQA